jgi:tetratricopeptide (TPR) repeat protein
MSLRKRRASPQTLRAATRLARHAEWAKGFWLTYLFSIAPNQVHILQDQLAEKLASIGREQRILRPATPQALEGILATILEHPNVGCVWVEAIRDPELEQGAWAKAWFNLILRMNERRELLREMLTGGLIFVAHPELKSAFRNAGPDLWSIRTMTFELPPGPAGDAERQVPAKFDRQRLPQFVDAELLDQDIARWTAIADQYSRVHQARTFMQLAARLRKSGRHDEAVQASSTAVERYRDLVALGLLGLRTQLADALRELADNWTALGEPDNAIDALREAIELLREPGDASSAEFASLVKTLTRLGSGLVEQQRPTEALDVITEAIERLRPAGEAFLPLLAENLGNLGSCSSMLGRNEDGLKATEASVSIYRRLSEEQGTEYAQRLSRSLHDLAARLHELGRREDAVAAAEEAEHIQRSAQPLE